MQKKINSIQLFNIYKQKQVENELSEPITLALNNPGPNPWHKILQAYSNTVEHGQTTLNKIAKSK